MAKILWFHDYFEGPVNGLAQYTEEKLWFKLLKTPPMISSTNISVPHLSGEERSFILIRLSSDLLKIIEDNHNSYCEATGAPIFYGDPFRATNQRKVTKIIPQGQDNIDAKLRTLLNVKSFNHSYDPSLISGENVTIIKEIEFINYSSPHILETQ